jgi:hypothetical protein
MLLRFKMMYAHNIPILFPLLNVWSLYEFVWITPSNHKHLAWFGQVLELWYQIFLKCLFFLKKNCVYCLEKIPIHTINLLYCITKLF